MQPFRVKRKKITLSFGATGTVQSEEINLEGKLLNLHLRVPNFTNEVTAAPSLEDTDDYEVWAGEAKAKNANYNFEVEELLVSPMTVKVTLSGDAGGTGGDVIVVLRYWSLMG